MSKSKTRRCAAYEAVLPADRRAFQEDRKPCRHGRALHLLYNFARINSSVRMSPAMAARLEDRLWGIGDIVKLIEDWETVTN